MFFSFIYKKFIGSLKIKKKLKVCLKMLEMLNKRTTKYKLNRTTIVNLKNILGFKGEGTKDSPIVIDDLGDFTVEISIFTEGIYLVLKNLTISKLSIVGSQHVVIEECFIADLETRQCRNLIFRSNTILRIKQVLCRNCIYENNSVLHKEYNRLINNTHERREFVSLWLILGVGMLFTHIGVSSFLALHVNYVSIEFLVSGISLIIAMTWMLILHFLANRIPKNEYVNFDIQELEVISNAFLEVIREGIIPDGT